ncbi:MAG: hypothetical protein CMB62_00090, partial [Euryarchaeota archaeon]|nr:hypothetical protein [Euryarchaeota archaeon]
CIGGCEAGESGQLSIYAASDPVFRKGGSPGTCGSSDCINDTTAPTSGNFTQAQKFTITAKTGYQHTLECDDGHAGDTNVMFQSETYFWGYDMENSGWETDQYTFDMTVTNEANIEQNFWTLVPGFSTLQITGTSDSSVNAVYTQEGTMTIEPSSTARPGTYTVGLLAESVESGNEESCTFSVIIPQPDLEVLDTDITFSQSSAWINSRGDSQRVIITATVRNNGGTVDLDGNEVKNVEVIFLVDGSQLGAVMVIPSLAPNGGETTSPLFMNWNPGRAHDGDEVGIPIKVSVDPSAKITESENDNNIGSQYFKVVKTKASNPSFYMSFLSLVGAVGAAVLLSTYYRNKDSEE